MPPLHFPRSAYLRRVYFPGRSLGTLRLFPRSCLTCAPEILRGFGARRHSVRTVSRRNQEQCGNVRCSEKRQRRERLETGDNPGGRCMAGGPCPPWRTVARARATDLPRVFGLALASARVFRGGGWWLPCFLAAGKERCPQHTFPGRSFAHSLASISTPFLRYPRYPSTFHPPPCSSSSSSITPLSLLCYIHPWVSCTSSLHQRHLRLWPSSSAEIAPLHPVRYCVPLTDAHPCLSQHSSRWNCYLRPRPLPSDHSLIPTPHHEARTSTTPSLEILVARAIVQSTA